MGPISDGAFSGKPESVRFGAQDLHSLEMRVWAEYQEMPGLALTPPQAARLFSMDVARCERVLRALVERGVLATDRRTFAHADAGARCA